jgi:rod shape-determining protein MreC
VATVVRIERDAEHSFARVVCRPAAGVDRGRYVLILAHEAARPERPDETKATKGGRAEKSRRARKGVEKAEDAR